MIRKYLKIVIPVTYEYLSLFFFPRVLQHSFLICSSILNKSQTMVSAESVSKTIP